MEIKVKANYKPIWSSIINWIKINYNPLWPRVVFILVMIFLIFYETEVIK